MRELEQRRLGARRLALTGFRVDGSVAVASVATSIPSREPRHLKRLLADKAAALDPGFGFDGFALEARWAEPLGAAQDSLVEEPSGERDVARLVDRLSVKLGPTRCGGRWRARAMCPSGRAGGAECLGGSDEAHCPDPSRSRRGEIRPQRLLDRPEAIGVVYATPEGRAAAVRLAARGA